MLDAEEDFVVKGRYCGVASCNASGLQSKVGPTAYCCCHTAELFFVPLPHLCFL